MIKCWEANPRTKDKKKQKTITYCGFTWAREPALPGGRGVPAAERAGAGGRGCASCGNRAGASGACALMEEGPALRPGSQGSSGRTSRADPWDPCLVFLLLTQGNRWRNELRWPTCSPAPRQGESRPDEALKPAPPAPPWWPREWNRANSPPSGLPGSSSERMAH